MSLLSLPAEIQTAILLLLNFQSLTLIRATCTQLRHLLSCEAIKECMAEYETVRSEASLASKHEFYPCYTCLKILPHYAFMQKDIRPLWQGDPGSFRSRQCRRCRQCFECWIKADWAPQGMRSEEDKALSTANATVFELPDEAWLVYSRRCCHAERVEKQDLKRLSDIQATGFCRTCRLLKSVESPESSSVKS